MANSRDDGMTTIDVLLISNGSFVPELPIGDEDLPAGLQSEPVQITSSLNLAEVDPDLGARILDACEPRYVGTKLYRLVHGFFRKDAPTPDDPEWDPDQHIRTAVALARLVRPHSAGTAYSARLMVDKAGRIDRIFPGPTNGLTATAFVFDESKRNWLSRADAEALRELCSVFDWKNLPPRVARALWNLEYAAYTSFAEIRWTIIATALESLVHTQRTRSTAQFKQRVAAIAAELGLPRFDEVRAADAYDLRSTIAHGVGLSQFSSPERELYCDLEDVLRAAIRRSVLDPAFAANFANIGAIEKRWPLR